MLSKLVVYWNIGRPPSDAPCPVRIAAPPHDARRPELRGGQTAGFDRDDRLRLVHVAGISRGEQAACELVDEWQRYRYFARERPPDPRRGRHFGSANGSPSVLRNRSALAPVATRASRSISRDDGYPALTTRRLSPEKGSISLATTCALERTPSRPRRLSTAARPGASTAVGTNAMQLASSASCAWARVAHGITPNSRNMYALAMRPLPLSTPCTSTGTPKRCSSSASSGSRFGCSRAPL